MNELVLSLLLWLGQYSPYDTDLASPNVVLMEPRNICANYGINSINSCEASNLVAFYNKRMTIYLPTSFDPDDLEDNARLLHELVHYVQWRNGESGRTCLGLLEVEAYRLQDRWLVQQGLKPASDEFRNILLAASCET